jgi:hypothetical protein
MKSIKNIISLVLILVMISSSLSAFAVELPYKVPYEYMEQKDPFCFIHKILRPKQKDNLLFNLIRGSE